MTVAEDDDDGDKTQRTSYDRNILNRMGRTNLVECGNGVNGTRFENNLDVK